MRADLYPLHVLLATLAGSMNRHQQDVIACLVEENRILEEQLKGRRLRLNDDQRRRLAAKAKRLGRRMLDRIATIVMPVLAVNSAVTQFVVLAALATPRISA